MESINGLPLKPTLTLHASIYDPFILLNPKVLTSRMSHVAGLESGRETMC
jgi:hypothetical protein